MPDQKFPFPFAKLGGCRIAVPDADSTVRQNASAHLRNVLETIQKHSADEDSLHLDHRTVSISKVVDGNMGNNTPNSNVVAEEAPRTNDERDFQV